MIVLTEQRDHLITAMVWQWHIEPHLAQCYAKQQRLNFSSNRDTRPMAAKPNILFIVLDTMRRDRLSIYGHDRETSPYLDAFAQDSTLFERAVSAAWAAMQS